MYIILNGLQEFITPNTKLFELLIKKNFNLDNIVVEYNYKIIKKNNWCKVILKDGDILEVLCFVGGG